MISQVRITNGQYVNRVGGDTEDFTSGVNILVGGNGSGKSSLIEAIRLEVENNDQRVCRLVRDASAEVVFYSGEAASGKTTLGSNNDLTTTRLSHGQRLLGYLANLNNITDNATIILDEPELALDFFAVEQLCDSMADRPDVQWIIASHHPLLMTWRGANFINFDRDRENYHRLIVSKLRQRLA